MEIDAIVGRLIARLKARGIHRDTMPTFCALAVLPLPQGVEIDGKDISQILLRDGATPHDELLLFQGEDVVGLRTQAWKYVSADLYMDHFMLLEGRGYPRLYDMRQRPEEYSVASLHPDIPKAMQERLKHAAARFISLRTGTSPLDRQRGAPKLHNIPPLWRTD